MFQNLKILFLKTNKPLTNKVLTKLTLTPCQNVSFSNGTQFD